MTERRALRPEAKPFCYADEDPVDKRWWTQHKLDQSESESDLSHTRVSYALQLLTVSSIPS